MKERIRESGGHWWEELTGCLSLDFCYGKRKVYGLFSGGKLVAVLVDKYILLDKSGTYGLGYNILDSPDSDCVECTQAAKIQTVPAAMQEAEEFYLACLTSKRDYYAGLWRNYTGQPVNADAAPVVHAEWAGIEYDGYADGSPVYDIWECSNCGEEHRGEENTLTRFCPHCGAKMDI